jgi:hypothetical protein
MIEIKRGKSVLIVSKGAYNDMFKSMGYEIVKEEGTKEVPSENKNQKSKEEGILNEDKKTDTLSEEESNSLSKEKKGSKNENKGNENNLENILNILSDNSKNNRQSKENKEEKK